MTSKFFKNLSPHFLFMFKTFRFLSRNFKISSKENIFPFSYKESKITFKNSKSSGNPVSFLTPVFYEKCF